MIAPIKLGWMAGVVDLKGRLIHKKNQMRATPQIVLIVETKEFGVVRELSNMTGTRPEAMDRRPVKDWMRRGCLEHCPEAHIHVHDPQYPRDELYMPPIARWTITGGGMYVVLNGILPYLQIDRGYPEAMDQVMINTPLTGQGATAVVGSLRRLHGLGCEMPEEFKEVVGDAAST